MNIKEAKEEIARTVRAYLQKDEFGQYLLPPVRQRPILLMGPPGVGKTAIMEQLAKEEHVALVSYTMTHHTRQSAVGLPRLSERSYDGRSFTVTDYTLSEILASVYDAMERTGMREGILFLDEINCVSETLAPTMLQFLQNKTFGNAPMPEGWLIIAAGNPPEYNRSVREFDIVTLDRVRRLEVEADAGVFLEYAASAGIHGAVISWLAMKPERFYFAERRDDGEVHYVTARGWEDLSGILQRYEALGFPVTEEMIGEFLCKEETVREFTAYYRLYMKYGTDYGLPEILSGRADASFYSEKCRMASSGDFTERFTAIGLLMACLRTKLRAYREEDAVCASLHEQLGLYLHGEAAPGEFTAARREALASRKRCGLLPYEEERLANRVNARLDELTLALREEHLYDREAADSRLKELFAQTLDARKKLIEETGIALDRAFEFVTDSFGYGQELTLFLQQLVLCPPAMEFISRHGCPAFLEYSTQLLFRTGEEDLRAACREALQ